MGIQKTWVCTLIALATLVTSGSAWAALGGNQGILIPYRGRLENGGTPVNSQTPYTFRFTLYDAASGGNTCSNTYDGASPVQQGEFNVVVGPVNPACVIGKLVFLGVAVRPPGAQDFVGLQGRQQVYPALSAMTAGTGDLDVSVGTVAANTVTAPNLNSNRLVLSGSNGVLALNDIPLRLRSAGDGAHGLAFRTSFGGVNYDGVGLWGYNGGTLGTNLNAERTALSWNSSNEVTTHGALRAQGAVTLNSGGGNVPHQCVTRAQTGNYITQCDPGEIALGGGGRCRSLYRLVESYPVRADGNPADNGQAATGWRAVCQVWGDNGRYEAPTYGTFAMCCRR